MKSAIDMLEMSVQRKEEQVLQSKKRFIKKKLLLRKTKKEAVESGNKQHFNGHGA